MDFYDVIQRRRSVRAYRKDPVEDEKLERVLNAARVAPSAANRQPVHLYVVRSEALRAKMLEVYGQQWFVDAPVIICACALTSRAWVRGDGKSYADVDVAIAMDHLILAAEAEGLGTCWIGAFKADKARAALNLPKDQEPVAMTPLGYAAGPPRPTVRKPLDEMIEYR